SIHSSTIQPLFSSIITAPVSILFSRSTSSIYKICTFSVCFVLSDLMRAFHRLCVCVCLSMGVCVCVFVYGRVCVYVFVYGRVCVYLSSPCCLTCMLLSCPQGP